MNRDIIKELNKENQRRAFGPPVLILTLFLVGVPVLGILVIRYGELVDQFASKHPLLTGFGLMGIGIFGWYKFGKRNGLW